MSNCFSEYQDAQTFQFINNIVYPNSAYEEIIELHYTLFNKPVPLRHSDSSKLLKR